MLRAKVVSGPTPEPPRLSDAVDNNAGTEIGNSPASSTAPVCAGVRFRNKQMRGAAYESPTREPCGSAAIASGA